MHFSLCLVLQSVGAVLGEQVTFMFTLKFLHLQLGKLLFFLKIQFVAFFLDLFPHKFNILSLCDSYVVLRPVHAFNGEVASNAVNKSKAGVQDFQDRAWGKDIWSKIFPEYPKDISRIHENISQIKRNICWNSMTGPEKKMSDVRSPKQKYLPEFIFLSFFWEGSTIHILHQYTEQIPGKISWSTKS